MLNPSSVQYILLKYFFTSLYWRHTSSVAEVEVGGPPVPPIVVPPLNRTSPFPLEFLHIHSSCYCQNSQNKARNDLCFSNSLGILACQKTIKHDLKLEHWTKLLRLGTTSRIVCMRRSEAFCLPSTRTLLVGLMLLTRKAVAPRADGKATSQSRSYRQQPSAWEKVGHFLKGG